jgi:hypothetical protein
MIEVRAADHAPTSISGVVAPTADVVAEVAAGGSVEGRVTGASGDPVPDAQVMVMKGMMGQGMRQSKTDGDGRYRIERVAAGTYTVMLVDMDNPMAPTMASVTVKDGETARHDFAKKSGGGKKVGGGVLKDGKPLSGAMVMLMGGNVGMKMATSDDAGRFGFDGLPPGEYTVLVQSSVMGGGATSKKVTVGADGKVEDVQLELSSAKIEGDVIDAETGEGVALAQITLTEPGTKLSSANDMIGGVRGQGFTDDRGHFVISDVQSGAFTLRVASGDYVPSVLDGVPAGSTGLKIRMHRGVEFQVTVQDADGRGVPNASVKSVDSSGRENMALDMTMSGFTRADGVATLRLVPGRYGLDVSAENMLPAHVDVDTTAGPATVTLSAGATLELAVVDADGAVVVGAKVVVKDSAGKEIARGLVLSGFLGGGDATDANGRYSRGGLPSGAVSVVVTVAGKDPTTVEATLEANKTKRVDVSIK